MARVIGDQFDDGTTATRRIWPAQYFKRKFKVAHAPLTLAEWRYLRSFYSARNGQFDSFYFRDNVNRDGNALVRFASDLPHSFSGSARMVQLELEEVAPMRALPEIEEVVTAAGVSPAFWFDANREVYYMHLGSLYNNEPVWDSALAGKYRLDYQNGGDFQIIGQTGQYQAYSDNNGVWSKSAVNVTELAAGQPAATLFAIVAGSTSASRRVLFATGTMGAGAALGLALAADNRYEPFLGGSETFTNARFNNTAANTWRSIALVWSAASNSVTMYVNGVLVGTDSVSRSLVQGRVTTGAALDGTLQNQFDSFTHCMALPGALTLAQVKSLHNLLGYQFGLATVA